MTNNDAENQIFYAERELDNLQILLKTTINQMENLDKNDLWGLLEIAQRQCSAIKPILDPVATHLQQLRIIKMEVANPKTLKRKISAQDA